MCRRLLGKASIEVNNPLAFTTCMPNGMNGRFTYAEVDELSDAFADYLRECVKLEAGARCHSAPLDDRRGG